MPVAVRRLLPSDVDLYRTLRLEALADSPAAFCETLESARAADWHARTLAGANSPDRAVFVALAGEPAVGMVLVRCDAENGVTAVNSMWVHPDYRRRGVGRSLLDAAVGFAQAAGKSELTLWVTDANPHALAFYQTYGFALTGKTEPLRPGDETLIHELKRSLRHKAS